MTTLKDTVRIIIGVDELTSSYIDGIQCSTLLLFYPHDGGATGLLFGVQERHYWWGWDVSLGNGHSFIRENGGSGFIEQGGIKSGEEKSKNPISN